MSVQQTLDVIIERFLLLHRVVEHLAKAAEGGVVRVYQKRPFSEHLLTFHRAGSFDILRDEASFAPSLSSALVRLWSAGWPFGVGYFHSVPRL